MAYATVKDKKYQVSKENFRVFVARSITSFIIFAFVQADTMIKENLKHNKIEFTDEELSEVLKGFSKDGVVSYDGNVVADVNKKKLTTVLKTLTPF